ncbi:Asp/Glu/hydantoin racemase [Methylobacterium sp. GXF4]|jgi:Asp/Glu/hydantoin racemase|uniref:Aspartate/glutamate racemase family protein n=1 Tax=Methylobacterium brachiatum TaxID=269660 RepID=A0ABV1R1B0_9HYPH|nr:aspartate/glutamate racemase family protein [Methylobacterium sp. GXF4]EIZ86930.1 Asp/Glu/hydantoin racemase [Methylobacterium sp. GXF4]MDF2600068.1 Asp/Glu/hydantoin racemase [Methylobacterium brachiatum]
MRILLLNPNTSAAMTARMAQAAEAALAPDVQIIALTAATGLPYIASRAEAQLAGAAVLETLAAHHAGHDAAVIAAYGDPGLIAARELFDLPVVGMAEAAMLTACQLGARFAIVTFSPALLPWYEDAVALAGLSARCVGLYAVRRPFQVVTAVQDELRPEILALAERVVADGADAVILAGAPLAGLATVLRRAVPVPLIDPLAAALGQAQALVRLGTRPPMAGRFARPPAKPATGLTGPLARWIAHREGEA